MINEEVLLGLYGKECLKGHVKITDTEYGYRIEPITDYASRILGDSNHYIGYEAYKEATAMLPKPVTEDAQYYTLEEQAEIRESRADVNVDEEPEAMKGKGKKKGKG